MQAIAICMWLVSWNVSDDTLRGAMILTAILVFVWGVER